MTQTQGKTCRTCSRDVPSLSRGMCGNCYRIWQRDHAVPNATCAVCGREYHRRSSSRPGGQTCSRECFAKWKVGRDCFNRTTDGAELIERECERCHKAFRVERRQLRKGFGRFCSLQCNALRRCLDPERSTSPENAWRQREGFTKLSQLILQDPAVCCSLCGARRTKGNLVVHHPRPPEGDAELLMDVDNTMVLCRACHMRVHHHGFSEEAA